MTFQQKLDAIVQKNNSLVCVGLDPELEKLPESVMSSKTPLFDFNKIIIDQTHDLVCAYKPNSAFYEAEGVEGIQQLKETINYIHTNHPDIPVILDAKRADIGNTARMYAKSAFDYFNADAVTVYPHLGRDSLEPFFTYKDKLTILLIKTSNPDSKMFQDLIIDGMPYFMRLAQECASWNVANVGVMVGATYPKELLAVRRLFPHAVFLSPGIGAQGGDMKVAIQSGLDANRKGIMFNASRTIIYASSDENFAETAREQALEMRDFINQYR